MIETAIDYKDLYEQTLLLYHQSIEAHKNTMLQITGLQHELDNLKRMIFGSKRESFIPQNSSSTQLSLDIQAETIATCSVLKAQKIEYTRNQVEIKKNPACRTGRHPGRTKLPEHLERREIIIEPAQKTEGCKKIGDEVTEELE